MTLDAATGPAVAGAPEAALDRTALARAAANLVANAAEHARSRVAVSCDVAGGHLVIEVADDGPGFSPAALERGCERLFTDDSSRSSRDEGRHYGLGLHVASEAASAHGGSVSLANSPSGRRGGHHLGPPVRGLTTQALTPVYLATKRFPDNS